MKTVSSPLQDQLDEITANTRLLIKAEKLAVSERAVQELLLSDAEGRILPVGARAPEFSLLNHNGRWVRSADLLALGPLIINFFRGRWCPYCAIELEAWRDLAPEVRTNGGLFVAVSPQTVRHNDFTVDQHALPFPVLSDPECKVSTAFGLTYTVSTSMQQHYRSILVNIPFVNGDGSWQLPLPATYVLDRTGEVRFAEAYADFRTRPEPRAVLAAMTSAG